MPIYQNNNTLDRIEEDIIDLNFILQPRWTTQRRLAINSGNTSRPTESAVSELGKVKIKPSTCENLKAVSI